METLPKDDTNMMKRMGLLSEKGRLTRDGGVVLECISIAAPHVKANAPQMLEFLVKSIALLKVFKKLSVEELRSHLHDKRQKHVIYDLLDWRKDLFKVDDKFKI